MMAVDVAGRDAACVGRPCPSSTWAELPSLAEEVVLDVVAGCSVVAPKAPVCATVASVRRKAAVVAVELSVGVFAEASLPLWPSLDEEFDDPLPLVCAVLALETVEAFAVPAVDGAELVAFVAVPGRLTLNGITLAELWLGTVSFGEAGVAKNALKAFGVVCRGVVGAAAPAVFWLEACPVAPASLDAAAGLFAEKAAASAKSCWNRDPAIAPVDASAPVCG